MNSDPKGRPVTIQQLNRVWAKQFPIHPFTDEIRAREFVAGMRAFSRSAVSAAKSVDEMSRSMAQIRDHAMGKREGC